jgi:hypothetical protein
MEVILIIDRQQLLDVRQQMFGIIHQIDVGILVLIDEHIDQQQLDERINDLVIFIIHNE